MLILNIFIQSFLIQFYDMIYFMVLMHMKPYMLYKFYAKVPSRHKASSNIVLHQEERNVID